MFSTVVEEKKGRKSEEELKVYRITIQVSAREKEKLKKIPSSRRDFLLKIRLVLDNLSALLMQACNFVP